jgi:hypothetical protein
VLSSGSAALHACKRLSCDDLAVQRHQMSCIRASCTRSPYKRPWRKPMNHAPWKRVAAHTPCLILRSLPTCHNLV